MIIGEKTIFAVEFYALLDTIPPFGRICYWIDGEAYGDIYCCPVKVLHGEK